MLKGDDFEIPRTYLGEREREREREISLKT
jgi:hypothetical protein